MDTLLANFIRALRNAEVRVSTAETLDAVRAVEVVGYRDRTVLKHSLSLVLPKTQAEKAAFNACFDKFFAVGRGNVGVERAIPDSEPDVRDAATSDSTASAAQGDVEPGEGGGGGGGGAAPHGQGPGETSPSPQSSLGKLLMGGDRLQVGMAIATAGDRTGVRNIQVFTQKSVYTRKIMEAMGLTELNVELESLALDTEPRSRRLANELTQRRAWLRDRVRDYVEHQYLLHADVTGKRLQEELLRTVRLSNIDQRHAKRMHEMVRRMAKRLVSSYSRRRRVYRRGLLHVPQTIRRNVAYDGAIFDLRWRSKKLDRPKVFVLCDVSGSVADYAKFMLLLLHSLEEVLPKVRSFAFSSDLSEVSDLFGTFDVETAIARILLLHGGSTDYARALNDFTRLCLADIDRRSTIIVLGDARNNYGASRSDLLKTLYERCQRLLWLNPEARSGWNLGDSVMQSYAAYCHQVEECSTLQHLERILSRLLRHVA